MGPVTPVLAGAEPGTRQRSGEGRLSWLVFLLILAAVTSSSLSVLSLYQLVALRAEVDALKSEVWSRREEGKAAKPGGPIENINNRRSSQELMHQPQHAFTLTRKRRSVPETLVTQPCLQLLANGRRTIFTKEFDSQIHIGIPWQTGLRRGSALEADGDTMLVREAGFYFVYSQVLYTDSTFAMGHVIIRRKRTVMGDETPNMVLLRCIQNMSPVNPYNTCYTGGVVELKVGDHLELLIPRYSANVSLEEDSTFLGAVKLA